MLARVLADRKRMGVEPGVPDIMIVTPPPAFPGSPGAVLELKDVGRKPTKTQQQWLATFTELGWQAGWADTLAKVRSMLSGWGYVLSLPCA